MRHFLASCTEERGKKGELVYEQLKVNAWNLLYDVLSKGNAILHLRKLAADVRSRNSMLPQSRIQEIQNASGLFSASVARLNSKLFGNKLA
jgi:hypothetical protein